jgi:broad specificity phosphatase PhoE
MLSMNDRLPPPPTAAAQRTIWLCRHGHRQDQADPDYKLKGDRPFDPPLSPRGRQQAAELAQRLEDEAVAAVFSSPFRRTTETACIVAQHLDLPVWVEPGLAEWLRADWFEGAPESIWMSPAELACLYPQVDPAHAPLPLLPDPPETHEQMLARTAATARGLCQQYAGSLLMIGHGASVAGAARGLMGARGPVGVTTPLCCLVKVVCRHDIWGLEMNGSDVSHLSDHNDLAWC